MNDRQQYTALAELGLMFMTVTVIFSFTRIFVGGDWLWPMLVIALLTHWVSSTWRKIPAPTPIQILAVLVGTTTATGWLLVPHTMRWWVPSGATFSAFGELLQAAANQYTHARAPLEATDGFVLAAILAVVVVGLMAEVGTFTIYTPLQAVIPLITLFGLTSVLGNGHNATFFTLLFVASASMFFLGYNRSLLDDRRTRWVNHSANQTNSMLLRSGVTLATVTLAVIAVLGPTLPDTLERAWWSWHQTNEGAGEEGERTLMNPFVDIQGRLVNQSREIAFTVRSDQGAYWRLLSLDRFDGQIWETSPRFRSVNGPFNFVMRGGQEFVQQVRIEGLGTDYLPAAAQPVAIFTTDGQVSYDDFSSALLLDHRTTEGFEYVVNSVPPDYTTNELRAALGVIPTGMVERYLELPILDPRIHELAIEITAGTDTQYDAALALQNFFRSEFTYDLDIEPGAGENALVHFLFEDRRGYCEQFAASYAALARSVGLPSRVAVGFTEGDQSSTDPTMFTVRGKHSHAWPEIYFPSIGWVPFEPTPGRYAPGSEAWTTLTAEQAQEENEALEQETNPETLTPTDDFFLPEDLFPEFDDNTVGAQPTSSESNPHTGLRLLAVLLGASGAWIATLAALRRGYWWWQDRRDSTAQAKILRAWQRVESEYARDHQTKNVAETYTEFAQRVATEERQVKPRLKELALVATRAHYSPGEPSGEEVALAQDLADAERREQQQLRPWSAKLRDAVQPRLN